MTKFATILLLAVLPSLSAAPAARAGDEPFIGEVMTVAFLFCPRGWAETRGQLLSIAQNQALFSLLGTTYGGNGTTSFALPNLRSMPTLKPGAPLRRCIALQGIFPSRP